VDDTLIVVERNTLEAVQNRANAMLVTVAEHKRVFDLRLSVDKTEAVVFMSRYGTAEPLLRLEGQAVWLGLSLNLVEVILENKGTIFCAYLRALSEKAERVMSALSGLMPNVGGPRKGRRRLLVSVVQSILLYGAPMWAPTLVYNRRGVEMLARVQRRAVIRSACAYRICV